MVRINARQRRTQEDHRPRQSRTQEEYQSNDTMLVLNDIGIPKEVPAWWVRSNGRLELKLAGQSIDDVELRMDRPMSYGDLVTWLSMPPRRDATVVEIDLPTAFSLWVDEPKNMVAKDLPGLHLGDLAFSFVMIEPDGEQVLVVPGFYAIEINRRIVRLPMVIRTITPESFKPQYAQNARIHSAATTALALRA